MQVMRHSNKTNICDPSTLLRTRTLLMHSHQPVFFLYLISYLPQIGNRLPEFCVYYSPAFLKLIYFISLEQFRLKEKNECKVQRVSICLLPPPNTIFLLFTSGISVGHLLQLMN